MTTLFPDFIDAALLRKIAEGDVDALRDSIAALNAEVKHAHQGEPETSAPSYTTEQ